MAENLEINKNSQLKNPITQRWRAISDDDDCPVSLNKPLSGREGPPNTCCPLDPKVSVSSSRLKHLQPAWCAQPHLHFQLGFP